MKWKNYFINDPILAFCLYEDNVFSWKGVLKVSQSPSELRFLANCSFFGEPLEGVCLLTIQFILRCFVSPRESRYVAAMVVIVLSEFQFNIVSVVCSLLRISTQPFLVSSRNSSRGALRDDTKTTDRSAM